MLRTIQFNWENYLNVISHELDKLEKQENEEKKRDYKNKISDNISKMWASLYKEIQFTQHEEKHDKDKITELNGLLAAMRADTAFTENELKQIQSQFKDYEKFLKQDIEKLQYLTQIRSKLIDLKHHWEKITNTVFSMDQQYKRTHIGLLEQQLLFKEFKQIKKSETVEMDEKINSLIEKISEKKRLWENQLTKLKAAIDIDNKSSETARSIGLTGKAKRYKEDINVLEKKLNETKDFLTLLAELEKKISSFKNEKPRERPSPN